MHRVNDQVRKRQYDSSWKHLSLIGDEEVISLSNTKVYSLFFFLKFCIMPWKDEREPTFKLSWEDILTWFKSSPECRALDTIDGEPMDFDCNIFPGFTTLELCTKVQELLSKMSVDPKNFTGRIIFMSTFNDISYGPKDNEEECELRAQLVSVEARRFSAGQWSFFGPGSEKKWYSTDDSKPQGEWDRVAVLMMIKFGESGHPVFRATSSLSRGVFKSKGGGKLSIHHCADPGTIETFFAQLFISVNQLSIYGAVSDLCEEWDSFHVETKRLGQSNPSFVPSVMKTHIPLTDDPAQEEDPLQRF